MYLDKYFRMTSKKESFEMQRGDRISGLDGLRAIAIILVIGAHASRDLLDVENSLWLLPITNGSFGVRLFFVLSGYLITRLLMREHERHGQISLRAFYMRRILRIFPAFYLYLATVAALSLGGYINASSSQLFAAGTYTWNYLATWYSGGPAEGAWFLGHLWTLSLEEQFYAFWPIIIVASGWKIASRTALILPIVIPIIRVLVYFAFPNQRGQLGMMFHTATDSIFIGCAFALWQRKLDSIVARPFVVAGAASFAFLVSPMLAERFRGSYSITMGFGLDAVCAGIIILNICQDGHWARILSWKPLALLGTWSYSIYIWQQLFFTRFQKPWTGGILWALFGTIVCALLSHYLIEKPILRWKKPFSR